MSSQPTVPPGAPEREQPESFRARSLSASLTVDDLQESLAWYRDVADFTVERKHEENGELRAVVLIAGSVRLVLTQDDGAKGWDREKGEGFSLHFTTVQDIDEIARRIERRGGTLDSPPGDTDWGGRALRVTDPDGFTLTIASVG
ncbi:MAG: VOC family protein [Longimicrobiales bacterium]|nr:VOC family protein [Longimicrobiales bacterium]